MAKEKPDAAADAAAQEAPVTQSAETPEVTDFPLTVDEFCVNLSKTDRRVEMIGAFHSSEKQAGRIKDKSAAYLARYEAFCNAPA